MATKPKLIPLSLNGITGEMTITENGEFNVKHLAKVIVNVSTGPSPAPTPPVGTIGDEETVNVITWSAFRTLVENKATVTGQIYSIEL